MTQAIHHNNDLTWSDELVLIYCESFTSLVRQAQRIVSSKAVAEEIVQEAFVTFHTKGCAPAPGRELAYVRSIALNSARSHLRRRACEERHRYLDNDGESIEDSCIRQEEAEALVSIVRELPEQQRRVVELRYWQGLSEQEIAEALDISSGSVKTHASRARARLRDELSKRD